MRLPVHGSCDIYIDTLGTETDASMFGLSPVELMVVGVVAVMLFGSKLPDVARSLGGSYREFKRGLHDVQEQFRLAEMEAKRPLPTPEVNQDDDPDALGPSSAPKFTPPPVAEVESGDRTPVNS